MTQEQKIIRAKIGLLELANPSVRRVPVKVLIEARSPCVANASTTQARLRSRRTEKPDGRAAFEPSAVIGSVAEELMVCRLFAGGR
jgi:hypothetical protein